MYQSIDIKGKTLCLFSKTKVSPPSPFALPNKDTHTVQFSCPCEEVVSDSSSLASPSLLTAGGKMGVCVLGGQTFRWRPSRVSQQPISSANRAPRLSTLSRMSKLPTSRFFYSFFFRSRFGTLFPSIVNLPFFRLLLLLCPLKHLFFDKKLPEKMAYLLFLLFLISVKF